MRRLGQLLNTLLGRRPRPLQVAAICLRQRKGQREVLLVSSLGTGRWVVPKGWPMKGRSLAGAALREAWEEAGVRGRVRHEGLGSFFYDKKRREGFSQRCEVRSFLVETESLAERYPEAGRRERVWLLPEVAAERVEEPELQDLLRSL